MYQQSLRFRFSSGASHADRLALLAQLAQQHAYLAYALDYSSSGHTCVLTALQPRVWKEIVPAVQAAQATGLLQILSPKFATDIA